MNSPTFRPTHAPAATRPLSNLRFFVRAGLAACLVLTGLQAQALGKLADISIIDRDTGFTLPVHYYQGDYWVAGQPGTRYAVSVRSKTGQRLLAVPAVDGVNVLSGQTAAWDQTGYVFSSYGHYQITGWRKSNTEIAAFEFANASNSYAGLTGRPGNVGVIGVALFREKQAEPVWQAPVQPPTLPATRPYGDLSDSSAQRKSTTSSGRAEAPASLTPPALAAAPAPNSSNADKLEAEHDANRTKQALGRFAPSPKLGTAHGQRETSVVSNTAFERQHSQPNEVIRIRYDSRENLIASGVIRPAPVRPAAPNAFPDSALVNNSYVPDPPFRRD